MFILKQMKPMSKILFSDFDGTLFFKEGFHQEDIEAIQTFQEAGNKFALCTGRPLGGVLALMEGKIKPDYYVLCTGGLVLDKDYHVVYGQEIPFYLVKEVCQKYENETITGPHCLDKDYLYFAHVPSDAPSYIKQFDSIDEFKDRKIYSFSLIESKRAKEIIEEIVREIEVGQVYEGTVIKLMNFGAFVDLGAGKEGLVHISKISNDRIRNIEDLLHEGDKVKVKVIEIDDQDRINLSMKDVDETKEK